MCSVLSFIYKKKEKICEFKCTHTHIYIYALRYAWDIYGRTPKIW